MSALQPHTIVQHYQPKGTFGKERGSTVSQPVTIARRYVYDFDTGKSTRSGPIKKQALADSYEVEGSTMRYMPYDFVTDRKNKKTVLRTVEPKAL